MRKRQKNYGFGGFIGTALGAGIGSIIPGVGTAVGASIGGSLGSAVEGMGGSGGPRLSIDPNNYNHPLYSRVTMATGGFMGDPPRDYRDLVRLAEEHGFDVTDTVRRGRGRSRHNSGHAIDVRTKNRSEDEITNFMRVLSGIPGLTILDERYGTGTGPHLHIQIGGRGGAHRLYPGNRTEPIDLGIASKNAGGRTPAQQRPTLLSANPFGQSAPPQIAQSAPQLEADPLAPDEGSARLGPELNLQRRENPSLRRLAMPLRQQQSSRRTTYATGGTLPLGSGALQVKGPSHEAGGVDLSNNVEVEGGETIDQVYGKNYVFSTRLKVPGSNMTFAEAHKMMLKRKASDADIAQLAALQEKISGRTTTGSSPEGVYDEGGVLPQENESIYAQGLQYLPHLFNLGTGVFGKFKPQQLSAQRIDRSALDTLRSINPRVSPTLGLRQNASAFRTAALNSSTPTRAALLAERLRADDSVISRARDEETNQRNALTAQIANAELDISRTEADSRQRANEYNTQARAQASAARQNFINAGLSGIVQTTAARRQERRAAATEERAFGIGALNALSGFESDENMMAFLESNPYLANLPLIQQFMQNRRRRTPQVMIPRVGL